MASEKTDTPRASNADVREYIGAMVGELAQMAEAIGEAEWAEALREAGRSDALQPQTPVTLRRS